MRYLKNFPLHRNKNVAGRFFKKTMNQKQKASLSKTNGINPSRVYIEGVGSYLPERVVTNDDLAKIVDTSDEWIRTRTGIRQRHLASEQEACSDLAYQAAQQALQDAQLQPTDIDFLIVATITPDMPTPSAAALVQNKLGLRPIAALDINAACSGFLYALEIARHFLQNEHYHHGLVIGSEKLSSITNWKDRSTCVLFGDGAGTVVVGKDSGLTILDNIVGADGSAASLICVPAGGSLQPASLQTVEAHLHSITMNGGELFKAAVRHMTEAVTTILQRNSLTTADIRYLIPHQANMRIVQALSQQLSFPTEQMICNIDQTGNTSSASIPIVLAQAKAARRFQPGDRILLVAFGGGLTWGATLLQQ